MLNSLRWPLLQLFDGGGAAVDMDSDRNLCELEYTFVRQPSSDSFTTSFASSKSGATNENGGGKIRLLADCMGY